MADLRLELKTIAVREDGCFSVLLWDRRPFAVSVERTFENLRIVIPNGIHHCVRSVYYKGNYATFEIKIAGHTRVLFHKGNLEEHSEACVIVAESFTVLNGQTAIGDSKGGFEELMQLAKNEQEFLMEVSGR